MKKQLIAALLVATWTTSILGSPASRRPNIVIIMADDSGFTDLGCYGGEIDTPNIDRLARGGLRFRNFYTNGRCSPTRASLMTGRNNARSGFAAGRVGGWHRELDLPSYRCHLPDDLPSIAEVLKTSGYHTMMLGKWHLGGSLMKDEPDLVYWWKEFHRTWVLKKEILQDEFNALPMQHGFDEYFGVIDGATEYFYTPGFPHQYLDGNGFAKLNYDRTYTMHYHVGLNPRRTVFQQSENNGKTAKAFFATDGITDRAIEMIQENSGLDKPPFFMYVAFRAPHMPLQAPKELVDKYRPRYEDVFQVVSNRVAGARREGVIPQDLVARYEYMNPNTTATGKEAEDLRDMLATHAAMVEGVDANVGRLVQTLEETGELENTLIFYLSDNGAAYHVGDVMNKPFYSCKSLLWEGGLKTHFIAFWPGVIAPGGITDGIGWVGDLLPTCLAVAGGEYPSEFKGKATEPLEGRNILPLLLGGQMPPPEYLFFNDRGQQAVLYKGRWKLLIEPGNYNLTSKVPGIAYELYDLENDSAETCNLAADNPERVRQLTAVCNDWRKRNGVIPHPQILEMLKENH